MLNPILDPLPLPPRPNLTYELALSMHLDNTSVATVHVAQDPTMATATDTTS